MAQAAYLQTSFLGGLWSPFAQGRADLETYRTGMNECLNNLPLEVGACTRRPGTLWCATTRNGASAVLRAFHFSQSAPYSAELTALHLRIFAGAGLLLEDQIGVAAISTANPAVVATAGASGFATGDQVEFQATPIPGKSGAGLKPIFNRQFSITVVDSNHFSLQDPVTGANINGSTIDITGWSLTVARVVDFTTAFTLAQLPAVRLVQDENVAFLCHGSHFPKAMINTVAPVAGTPAVFTYTTPTFLDGPYLDPPTDGTTMTPSAKTGTITLTASSIASINNGQGFLATDVGRQIRLFSQPAAWATGTTYSKGTNVLYDQIAYSAVATSKGVQPDLDNGTNWVINPTGQAWSWATIATVSSTSVVTAALAAADPLKRLAGGDLLYTTAINYWQLGLYSDTTGYPSGGCFHEGRFWLFGAVANRMDSNMSNNNGDPESGNFYFSPTLLDGTVSDDCGISAIFNGSDRNTIFWAEPDHQGIIIGTQAGEWLMQASNLNEEITPTSIQAHRVTKYGCANVEARHTGLSHVFVQRYALSLYEYVADVYSGKFSGTNIARKAKQITSPGIAEIAYQAEKAPVIWCRTTDNRLIGCTYKRESPFSTQPASFYGWHHHTLGSGREIECIQGGPSPDGATDSLMMVTNDTATDIRYVEMLSSIPDETDTLTDAWFLDAAVTPASAEVIGTNVVFYGLEYVAGDTLAVWVGGVDAGDYTVAADGSLTVPIDGTATGSGGALFLTSLLATLNGGDYGTLDLDFNISAAGSGFFSPTGALLDFTQSHSSAAHFAQNFQVACVDWDAQRLYIQSAVSSGDGEPSSNGRTFYAFNTATQAQVANASPGAMGLANTACLGYDGHIYYNESTTANIGRYNTTTHAVDVAYTDTHSLPAVGYVAPIVAGSAAYVLATGLNSGQGSPGNSAPWFIVNMTGAGGPAWTGASGFFDERIASIAPGNAFPCRGPAGAAYVLCVGTPTAGVLQCGVYKAGAAGPTSAGMGKIGAFTPSQVSGGWTTLALIGPPIYDETDGNLIAEFQGSDLTLRIAKINTSTAAIMWTLTVVASVDFRQSRVRGGRFSFIDGSGSPWTLKEIDTLTGTVSGSSPTETVLGPTAFQTDDLRGQIIAEINDIGTQQWATFGPASGGGAITPAVVYNAPAVIGFNYQSKGQILRPVIAQDGGFQTGPGQGKLRRMTHAAPYFANTQYVQMGVDFRTMRQVPLASSGGTQALTLQQLFTGILLREVDDTDSFNSMWCWQTTRPYPCTVVSVECFLEGKDQV